MFCKIKSHFCQKNFPIDWCHAYLKNTTGLLLFNREHFYGYSEIDHKNVEKKPFISQQTYLYIVTDILKFYEDSFVHIVKVCFVFKKQSFCLYSLYMHKILPTSGNKKEQWQIKFYEKLLGELIFLQVTKNLKMLYFTCLTGRVLKK